MGKDYTWDVSILKSCLAEADSKTHRFTRKGLLTNHLERMVKEVDCVGKTPTQTISRCLQSLRDEGFLKFMNRGNYQLMPSVFSDLYLNKTENKMSKGERLVSSILRDLGIPYQREKSFSDLKHKSFLRFDFYFEVNGRGFVIEFDGEQHRKPIDFFGGQKALEDLQYRDKMKEEYCKNNNIKLIRVQDYNVSKIRFIVSKSIYEEIKDDPKLRSQGNINN